MAHGSRGRARRLLLAGLGLVIGTALSGCMDSDKKPIAKPQTPLPGTPQVRTGMPGQPGGGFAGQPMNNGFGAQPGLGYTGQPTGVMQTGARMTPNQQGVMQTGGANPAFGNTYNSPAGGMGLTGTPAGAYNPNVPSVMPNGGAGVSPGYNTQGAVTPTTPNARGQAASVDPPVPMPSITDPLPPSPPSVAPSVAPAGVAAPQAPLSPLPPSGTRQF